MTKNQIEYLKYLETLRSNSAQESLTNRRDQNTLDISLAQLNETKRRNLRDEDIRYATLGEQARHNLAQERFNSASLDETSRANKARETLNLATNREVQRHNFAQELNAKGNLALGRDTLYETSRANLAREKETYRSNLAREAETHRSNVAYESENRRSHLANEANARANIGLGYSQLAEQQTYHDKTIATQNRQINANKEVALRSQDLQHQQNILSNYERERSNRASELNQQNRNAEMERHNRSMEALETTKTAQSGFKTIFDVGRIVVPLFK